MSRALTCREKGTRAAQTQETAFDLLAHQSGSGPRHSAGDSGAQEPLRPYASPILHTFLDSAIVFSGERDGGPEGKNEVR